MTAESVTSERMPAVEIRGATKVFNPGGTNEVLALGNIDLNVDAGDFVTLIGPSGCGKSTLLRLVAAAPDDGAYRTDIAEEALANLHDQGVDVVGSGFERIVVELLEGGE